MVKHDSFSDFELDFGDWNVYKWKKIYYDSSEARDFSIDIPPFEESLGSSNEVIKLYYYNLHLFPEDCKVDFHIYIWQKSF